MFFSIWVMDVGLNSNFEEWLFDKKCKGAIGATLFEKRRFSAPLFWAH